MRWKAIACIAILAFALAGTAGAQTRYENWARCKDPNPDLAIGACTAIIQSGQETNENLPRAFFNRGIGYDNKGEYDRAIQDYDQAIKLNPNLAQAYSGRGDAYDEKHEYDRAIQDLDQAIRLEPNNAQAFNSRCWARAILGQLPQALADCNESLRLHPDNAHNAEVLDSRGLVYLKMKRFDAAIADYDASLKLSPKVASSPYGRGIAELSKATPRKPTPTSPRLN
jgi:tetratricopeptide (TPR) repeat protein